MSSKPQQYVFLDGEFVSYEEARPHFLSQTFHYGNGVFEGMRSYETADGMRIFRSREHYRRLLETGEKLYLSIPYTKEELTRISYTLLEKNQLTEAYIRPIIYVGENMSLTATRTSHICISAWKWDKMLGDKQLNLMISSYRRLDPRSGINDAKICGYYVNNILSTSEAKANGYNDAVLLDVDGYLACGSGANLFIEKDEVLYTPPAGHIIMGITRGVIMKLAQEMGVKVVEKRMKPEELFQADGAFFTGTAVEVAAIGKVENQPLKMTWEDTIGYVLSRKYRRLVTRFDNFQHTLI